MYLYLVLLMLPASCVAEFQLQLETREQVRLRGEPYSIPCTAKTKSMDLSVKWLHPQGSPVNVSLLRKYDDWFRIEAVLNIKAVEGTDSGNFTCVAKAEEEERSAVTSLRVVERGYVRISTEQQTALVANAGENIQLQVKIEAYPKLRQMQWIYESKNNTNDHKSTFTKEFNSYESSLSLVRLKENESGDYTFSASNDKANSSLAFQLVINPHPVKNAVFTPVLSGSVAVAVLLLFFLGLLLYKYKQKPTYEIRWKIIEAVNGNDYTFIDPTQLPYNGKWEFPREKLRLGKILGAGAFGKVVEATAYGLDKEDSAIKVAVKMLKPSAHSTEKEALMSELKILSHLGQHTHVVNLLGACTLGGPVLVITEYCCYGDLLNFLKSKAQYLTCCDALNNYKNLSHHKRPLSDYSEGYLPMRPRLSSMSPMISQTDSQTMEEDEDQLPLDVEDLLSFSYQVATGMDFLSSRNCIHRDLAARNILLTEGRVAKICDFGLARDIMNDSNYIVKGNARLPVKWMAPESIFDCVYTVQSDVWSYGILLWEIFSLGSSPYPGVPVDTKFYKSIRSGFQMDRPGSATPELYDIMTRCWNLEPTDRPTFDQIVKLLNKQRGEFSTQDYRNLPIEHEVPESPTCHSPNQSNCETIDETVLLINPYSKI
ncbi:macrophage colony-stimulating factor 1 receptor-like [Scyliorhinus torazame]|uniref:macrophage colony-stimulating factor 1 receptor-like n=1 Tax=Scyliorhinus torazame TaxID=75743 RepID=UPI003B5B9372